MDDDDFNCVRHGIIECPPKSKLTGLPGTPAGPGSPASPSSP